MSHNALRTFSSNVGSTTLIVSPAIVDVVSRPYDMLSLHFDGGAAVLAPESMLLRPSGEIDFVGPDVGWVVSEFGVSFVECECEDIEGRPRYCCE